jgi:hypothetical protein
MIARCVAIFGILIATAACDSSIGPSNDEDVRLTVTVAPSPVLPGQIATITVTLENAGDEEVHLTFNTGCQILPYIREQPVPTRSVVVYPADGEWSCTLVVTQLTLQPGGSVRRVVRVRAPNTPGEADAVLPPGEYQTFARLDDIRIKRQSEPVSFVIQ